MAVVLGTMEATTPGVVKMPTPITFEMTMAEASSGPSRRSRDVQSGTFTRSSLGEQASSHRKHADALPLHRAVFREEFDGRVNEMTVAQHFLARLLAARVSQLRSDRQRRGL